MQHTFLHELGCKCHKARSRIWYLANHHVLPQQWPELEFLLETLFKLSFRTRKCSGWKLSIWDDLSTVGIIISQAESEAPLNQAGNPDPSNPDSPLLMNWKITVPWVSHKQFFNPIGFALLPNSLSWTQAQKRGWGLFYWAWALFVEGLSFVLINYYRISFMQRLRSIFETSSEKSTGIKYRFGYYEFFHFA